VLAKKRKVSGQTKIAGSQTRGTPQVAAAASSTGMLIKFRTIKIIMYFQCVY